ncbi:MAG: fatty acid--CoA ligase [Candidatus Vecturithrix sp.]|nr:fatty acid--CoA ligase [Candidatus Vecturithrix sp.]
MHTKQYQLGESYQYQLLIKHILHFPLTVAPDQEIIYRDQVRLTYRALNERVHRLACGLAKLGVGKGDTVCVFDYDSHRYLECYFAVPMMGAVLHTQNWRLSPEQILYTMNHAEDDVVIIHEDFFHLLEGIRNQLTSVKKIILIKENNTGKIKKCVDFEYEDLLRNADSTYDFPDDLDENTKAATFYTTGTTGLPKGVYFSHRQIVLHAMVSTMNNAVESPCRFRSNDVYMPITPMFHVMAWGLPYVATLLAVKQVYPGKYEPDVLLGLIEKEKVTYSHCVATIMLLILNSPTARNADLTRWKVIIGGGRLPKGLALEMMKRGIETYSGYGMSESGPNLVIANLQAYQLTWEKEKQIDTLISTGYPLPFVYLKIIDEKGRELPRDGESAGEIVVRAPWLTESYFKDPERSRDLWRDGWMHTGDVAYAKPNGYIQITDRAKDVIKTGGEWVSSLDLENAITQHTAVMEAAAIGVPDPKWQERPLLVVVLHDEFKNTVSEIDLKEFMIQFSATGKLPKYAIPDRIEIVDQIPKTSVGKINKIALRRMYA